MSGKFEVDISKLDFARRDNLNEYLLKLVKRGGSDLHIKSGSFIYCRIGNEIQKISDHILTQSDGIILAKELLRSRFGEFVEAKSIDFTHRLSDKYRFRVNMFFQLEGVSAVFRLIPSNIPSVSDLNLPPVVERICDTINRGLVFITGEVGSGKSTTVASMINHINSNKKRHIITIEDPIEFVYTDMQSIVNQRAIGQDACSFSDAVSASLREDPDVLFIGDIADIKTLKSAIVAVQNGRLVLSTINTANTKDSINYIVNMFPAEEKNQAKMIIASSIEAIISQRMIRTLDDRRRVAMSIMIKNTQIENAMRSDECDEIYNIMENGRNFGMQTIDQHLFELYEQGVIDAKEALEKSEQKDILEEKIKRSNTIKDGLQDYLETDLIEGLKDNI